MPTPAPLDPILDGAACGYLSVDETGLVRTANTTLAHLIGRSRESMERRHIDQLLSPAGRIFYTTHLFPLLQLQGRAEEVYLPLQSDDGEDIPVLVNGLTRHLDGTTVHELIIVPMRQRNELENELITARKVAEQAASAKDRFLSIVSHELRTPLGAARGMPSFSSASGTGS